MAYGPLLISKLKFGTKMALREGEEGGKSEAGARGGVSGKRESLSVNADPRNMAYPKCEGAANFVLTGHLVICRRACRRRRRACIGGARGKGQGGKGERVVSWMDSGNRRLRTPRRRCLMLEGDQLMTP